MGAEASTLIYRTGALPDVPSTIVLSDLPHEPSAVCPPSSDELEAIAGFTCYIEYEAATRRIVCRRFDLIGSDRYVGAICQTAQGYRQFRTDRISLVADAITGEVLGGGEFFDRFAPDSFKERTPTWGLSASQRSTLIAGLNVLAFIARCDGRWHPLEREPIEAFICSMWLRKEWPNNPPLADIYSHAQRLAPDAETFFRSLARYAQSQSSTSILRRAITAVVEADGAVLASEFKWQLEVDEFFNGLSAETLAALASQAHEQMFVIRTS